MGVEGNGHGRLHTAWVERYLQSSAVRNTTAIELLEARNKSGRQRATELGVYWTATNVTDRGKYPVLSSDYSKPVFGRWKGGGQIPPGNAEFLFGNFWPSYLAKNLAAAVSRCILAR